MLDFAGIAFQADWRLRRSSGAGFLEAQAGGAFIEEIVYRGVLLPQLLLLLAAVTRWRTGTVVVAAVFGSQLYFALAHLPAAVTVYAAPWTGTALYLTQVLFVGIFFAVVYWRTGNLFVAIGLHALINFPGELFVARIDPFFLSLVVCCGIVIAWPYLNRSLGDVFTLTPSVVQPALADTGSGAVFDDNRVLVQ